MAVERITPQLVKKGKGKKRPGYAGWTPGAGSPGTTKSGGNKNTGSTGRERGADRNRNQRTTKSRTPTTGPTNIHTDNPNAPAPYTFIGGKKYNVTPETKAERNRAELKQQIMNQTKLGGNRIDKFGNTKKSLFRKGGGGINSLLTSLFGLAMGIPGLGLFKGGLGKIGEGLGSLNETLGDFREKTTGYRTQKEYEDARTQRQLQGRLDNMYDRKSKGKNFSQKNMDMLEAMGLQPSTAQNVLTGRDLKGFTESRGLKTPERFLPNPGPKTHQKDFLPNAGPRQVNIPAGDAVSTLASSKFNRMKGYTDDYPNLGLIPSKKEIPTVNDVPMINTGSVYQDNLNFFDNLNKGLVVNNEPPMVNTDNVMQGSVLDAKPKKGIMQMISDAFISPAGADEFDMEAFQKAGADKGFFGANDELEAMKEYYDAAKSLSAPGSKFAGATNPNEIRSFIETQSNIPFGGGSYGVNMDMVPTNFMNTTEDFTTQKDPLTFFADGGLASMFTRRG